MSVLGVGEARADNFQPVNLALNKPSRQSSKAYGGEARRANDGNENASYWWNSVTHTDYDPNS